MALKRSAMALWKGNGAEGSGAITTKSGAMKDQPYSVKTRFVSEDGRMGTNPEELIAAAHASCFAMASSFALTNAGHPPTELDVEAIVTMDKEGVNWSILGIQLVMKAKVPGIDAAKFQATVEGAKKGCPISRALASVPITLDAKLV